MLFRYKIYSRLLIVLKKASLGLVVVKEVHRVITYDKKSCLKPYTDMKTEVNKKERNDFEKKIF